jgi:hypothetical protein
MSAFTFERYAKLVSVRFFKSGHLRVAYHCTQYLTNYELHFESDQLYGCFSPAGYSLGPVSPYQAKSQRMADSNDGEPCHLHFIVQLFTTHTAIQPTQKLDKNHQEALGEPIGYPFDGSEPYLWSSPLDGRPKLPCKHHN